MFIHTWFPGVFACFSMFVYIRAMYSRERFKTASFHLCSLACMLLRCLCVLIYMFPNTCNSHPLQLYLPPPPYPTYSKMRIWLLTLLCLLRAPGRLRAEMQVYQSLPHHVDAVKTPVAGPGVDVACASTCSHSAGCVGFVWNTEEVWNGLLGFLLNPTAVDTCLLPHLFLRL